jgi:hypothetical protein
MSLSDNSQRETYLVFIDSLLHLRRLIGGNCENLYTQLLQLRFDLSQLDQLLIAVRSPTAPIKDEHGRLLADGFIEIQRVTIGGAQSHRRHGGSRNDGTDVLRLRAAR